MKCRRLGLLGVTVMVVLAGVAVAGCAQPTEAVSPIQVESALEVSGTTPVTAPVPGGVTSPVTVTGMTTDTGGIAVTGDLTATTGVTSTVVLTSTEGLTPTVDAEVLTALGNLTYHIDGQDYALVEGIYDDPTARTRVHLVPMAGAGDLNGDAVDDAAALLAIETGGSGTFEYLVPVIADTGAMLAGAAVPIGDRVQVKRVAIDGGVITLEVVTHGPNDPMCCPTLAQVWTFAFADGTLKLTSSEGPALP
jgi:hypothetical protein